MSGGLTNLVLCDRRQVTRVADHHASGSPAPFRIDLGGAECGLGGGSLSFGGTQAAHVDALSRKWGAPVQTVGVSRGTARLLFASQVLIVAILALLIFALLFFSFRVYQAATLYSERVSPYVAEFSQHSMDIMRHADVSAASLEHVMHSTENLSTTSIPEIMESVNRTASMVARMQQVAANPVIKLSMA